MKKWQKCAWNDDDDMVMYRQTMTTNDDDKQTKKREMTINQSLKWTINPSIDQSNDNHPITEECQTFANSIRMAS